MSGWSEKLRQVLERGRDDFGVSEVRNPGRLDAAQQTGFVWTRQPGVVCLAANRAWFAQARDNPDMVAIIAPPAVADREQAADKAVIVCEQADQLYHFLHATQPAATAEDALDIDSTASIDPSAVLRGAVLVEAGVRIGPRAVISGPVVIRHDARIDAGAIVGCEGLYAKLVLGSRLHMPHYGGIEIGAGAFIHSGAVIVRSAVKGEVTRIGERAHVGVMTNVGHDSEICEAATVSSNCVIAGRVRIGARAWIGASVSISNMVDIGDDADIRIGAVVIRDVPAKGDVSGNFARDHVRNMRRYLQEVRDEG
jgi:UDP-3-O-[3-hydroxymyristoyl] glucosamine N-acyltransferase